MKKAYDWAGISTASDPIGADQFNPPFGQVFKKTPVWADHKRRNPAWEYGHSGPDDRSRVVEHPFGHPDLIGDLNHDCPHFHAVNALGVEMEFPDKSGT
jgi:hypothetical protein